MAKFYERSPRFDSQGSGDQVFVNKMAGFGAKKREKGKEKNFARNAAYGFLVAPSPTVVRCGTTLHMCTNLPNLRIYRHAHIQTHSHFTNRKINDELRPRRNVTIFGFQPVGTEQL